MTVASLASLPFALVSGAAPSPPPATGLDPSSISPGLVGFLATFALVGVCILLFLSMSRRLRRMRYRGLQEEQRERDAQSAADAARRDAGDDTPDAGDAGDANDADGHLRP